MKTDTCLDCGNPATGGKAGCLAMFEEVIAREFSDYRYGRVHRLTVDVYSLQHPEPYIHSAKSFAAHLTGICLALEHENAGAMNQVVQRWLSGAREVIKPARLVTERPPLTVAHVLAASSAEEHLARVHEWANAVWNSWSNYHDLAREWIALAMRRKS
jgi:hypothetical protein